MDNYPLIWKKRNNITSQIRNLIPTCAYYYSMYRISPSLSWTTSISTSIPYFGHPVRIKNNLRNMHSLGINWIFLNSWTCRHSKLTEYVVCRPILKTSTLLTRDIKDGAILKILRRQNIEMHLIELGQLQATTKTQGNKALYY